MSLDALCESLPAYAKDLSANLENLASETVLTEQQKWGAFVAAAYAVGTPQVVRAINEAARQAGLSPEATAAARAAAAVMGMNNVYYRSLYLISNPEYRTMPAKLRMNVLADPGVPKVDFELWSAAVSAVNGCGMCLDAHETELRRSKTPSPSIQAALRIAAVVKAVSGVISAEAAAVA
ncbi:MULTISPECIES: carboxymuconolactone decarboxylase family protein [Phenylobacterium]|uniref:Alkyl hydroperoxide reductase AhpD n=1 Tax=Phenylobacterium koreense TaxID=266125 RepID=A0ABV2EHA8_9CAUL